MIVTSRPIAYLALPIVYRRGIDRAAPQANLCPIDNRRDYFMAGRGPELLPGTLDLLILRTLVREPMHGYGISNRVRELSKDVLRVGESSLYPALQRLLLNGWLKAEWGTSENNRRARYYTLTAAGKQQLVAERQEFERIVLAIQNVLQFA